MDRFMFFPLAARFVLLVIMLIPLLISGLTLAVYQNEVPQEERAPFWTTALSGLAVTNMVMVVYTIYPTIRQKLWKEMFWSRSFCLLSSGGAPIETIRQYIENQGERNDN